jgi:peptidoglycan/LPS O-acetylase OafA/YrhL
MWDGLFAATFAARFRFAQQGIDYFAQAQPSSPLLHFWSLGVVQHCYLVWPVLLSVVLFGSAVIGRRRSGERWQHRHLLLVVGSGVPWQESRLAVDGFQAPVFP